LRKTSEGDLHQMKTSPKTLLLQASLTNSSACSEQNDQALPSLSPSHSLGSEQDCPPALATLASAAASQVLKRSTTEPGELQEPAAKRAKLAASKETMERNGSVGSNRSISKTDNLADMVPSNSFIENSVVDLPPNPPPSPNPTQLEYDPAASISSFDRSPSVLYAEQVGQK
jgi:hypothetical protein